MTFGDTSKPNTNIPNEEIMRCEMEKVYVLGGAQTDFERNWTKEGKNVTALLKEVITDGFDEAGISFTDIEQLNKKNKVACFVGNFIAEEYINQGHLGALISEVHPAFYGVPSARYEAACASSSVALDAAITKLKSGDYDVAVVIGWELMKTVDSKTGGDILGRAAYYEKEGKGIDFPFPKLFGKLADEILRKYSIDEQRFMDSLAIISNTNYSNAKRNSKSQTRNWFMNLKQAQMRGTETNPLVGGRLAVSDCSQVTDGAAVIVLASEKYVKENYKKTFPVVKGFGHRVAPMLFDKKIEESRKSPFLLPWTRQAVVDAYTRSGLTVEDIDFFETHDCFTSSEYAAVSAFGISEPGKEFKAIEEGIIAFDGNKPINPSGGLIGCGHPVGASGARMFLDLYKQVSRKAEGYQLKKADNGIMLNIGGSATTNYVFIVGNE
ncbi:acetyl-CoA acetyltransferase [Bacillus sp. 1P10SD]|uniref:acetyl-CoA acetyltransferase n=1 Tax=Bacillus sp. 1P10SD TaxID=3132265 RepID=UPI0039A6EF8A